MGLEFRPFEETDFGRCAEISAAVWPVVLSAVDETSAAAFMRGYIELCDALSDYAEVCCENKSIAGFLFGCSGSSASDKSLRRRIRSVGWNYITGKYGGSRRRIRLIFSNIYSFIKSALLCSRFEGEVVLFAVSPEFQGRGIGRALLDRFMEHTRKKDLKTVSLSTDIESNWRFYEKYGFIKYRDYTDNGLSAFTGKRVRSFIYYYRL